MAAGASLRSIAKRLGRTASTVSRELRRNGDLRRYRRDGRPARLGPGLRSKRRKLAAYELLRRLIVERLERNGSPEQILAG